jgi:hypothetical protein
MGIKGWLQPQIRQSLASIILEVARKHDSSTESLTCRGLTDDSRKQIDTTLETREIRGSLARL